MSSSFPQLTRRQNDIILHEVADTIQPITVMNQCTAIDYRPSMCFFELFFLLLKCVSLIHFKLLLSLLKYATVIFMELFILALGSCSRVGVKVFSAAGREFPCARARAISSGHEKHSLSHPGLQSLVFEERFRVPWKDLSSGSRGTWLKHLQASPFASVGRSFFP